MFRGNLWKVVVCSLGFLWFYILGVIYGWRNEWVGMASMFVGAIILGVSAFFTRVIHVELLEMEKRIEKKSKNATFLISEDIQTHSEVKEVDQ